MTAQAPMPWEDRPEGVSGPMWRNSGNPIIPRDLLPRSNSIFNSAVVPFEGAYAGVFRVDDVSRTMNIHAGRSADGLAWEIAEQPIVFAAADHKTEHIQERFVHAYDPRVTWLEDRYWVSWCNNYNNHGPTIGIGWTTDFKEFTQVENAFLPFNRNGVLFPRKVDGAFAMYSRPSDNGHTPFGDIFYSESPEMAD